MLTEDSTAWRLLLYFLLSRQDFILKFVNDLFGHSLIVYMVMNLQIEYPDNVHLIRGNHEAADINALFGFRLECIERMVGMDMYLQH